MDRVRIEEIDFPLAAQIWSERLWPNRNSPIEPISWIDISGEINMGMLIGSPIFLAAFNSLNEISGLISGFSTGAGQYRSRGIWVDPKLRHHGLGRSLIRRIEEQALHENCKTLWTMPRLASLEFYLKVGFQQHRSVNKYEFGPHVIALKKI